MGKCNHARGAKPAGNKVHVSGHTRKNENGTKSRVLAYDRKKSK